MKDKLHDLLTLALDQLKANELIDFSSTPPFKVDYTKNPDHGDFATNVALVCAKMAKTNPRVFAQQVIDHLPANSLVDKVEIAGPGFLNFFLHSASKHQVILDVLQQSNRYGYSDKYQGQRVLVEFVSANPTGPLHVGHGRGAVYGSVLSDLLAAVGYEVHREYYVNDAGRQMDILAASLWLRYLALFDIELLAFPENGYQGQYLIDIANQLKNKVGDLYCSAARNTPPVEMSQFDALEDEPRLDAYVAFVQSTLGTHYAEVHQFVTDEILSDIKNDLEDFGIHHQNWYSEQSLHDNHKITAALSALKEKGHTYEKEGALWFNSTHFGDEKDRVLVRDNGQPTYFAPDIAYHDDKFKRGFDKIIDILGADHHGYVKRMEAALTALGYESERFKVLLVQFAILYRGDEKVSMSTRAGEFVTLRELREEVGKDACRFFYSARKHEQHMDFDLELAKEQNNNNPLYYIQYAHARLCSLWRQASERDLTWQVPNDASAFAADTLAIDAVVERLSQFPDTVMSAAQNNEPHLLTHYLRDLAQDFHGLYNQVQFLVEDPAVRNPRLAVCAAIKQVLANGLTLLGVEAPEEM